MPRPYISLYDRVADRLAAYSPEELDRLRGRIEPPNPEDRFTAVVCEHLQADDGVLDIGCGDGLWLRYTAAPIARRVVGVDYGMARLAQAVTFQRAAPLSNLAFLWADARHLPFAPSSFTALINRRGPLTHNDRYFDEGCRALQPGGLVLEITIGEQNAHELYEVFGRGQMFGEPERGPRLDRMVATYLGHGLSPIVAESHDTREVFSSRESLAFLLETTPMIEDFDRTRDSAHVDEMVRRYLTADGLRLTLHRLIIVARKL